MYTLWCSNNVESLNDAFLRTYSHYYVTSNYNYFYFIQIQYTQSIYQRMLTKNKMLILTYQCLIKCIFCPVCWLTSLSKHCIKYVLSTHQIIWFFFFSAGDWTQGLTHAKQLFYLWATPPAPKFYFYFYFLFTYLFF
jgi:hypothetical protein